MMARYNPRNRNEPIDGNRKSWSTAFDGRVEQRKEVKHPCGFYTGDGGTKI